MSDGDFVSRAKRLVDVIHENRLVIKILQSAYSGNATDAMVEQAIALVDRHITVAKDEGDAGMLKSALNLKSGLEQALIYGVKSLRVVRGPGDETLKVEVPLTHARMALGHKVKRQQ